MTFLKDYIISQIENPIAVIARHDITDSITDRFQPLKRKIMKVIFLF